jgi:hypothetical protein
MSTPAQKFLQKLSNASSFDINVSNFKSSPTLPSSTSVNHLDADGELRYALQEKRLAEDELRKTKNSLDAVVSELVLSENEVCNITT